MIPDAARWRPWSPEELHQRFRDCPRPWYVAAGWAIDLFLAAPTREHEDIEIGIAAHDFTHFANRLDDCELYVAGSGRVEPLTDAGLQATHQTWVLDPRSGEWRLDIFREPSEDGQWVARRDPRLRLDYTRLILRTAEGIPFAAPEVVLLFKAKARRAKDEADFARVLPELDGGRREWLRRALALAHPGHPWLDRL